ncbi:hypothetical protein [Flavobacterium sp.]|uniref:hypothetical protein n=1 Tax=Flavobacterium sp. TaxID=239 RepID=UPI00260A0C18|nr:hypothetical protein [Flavobacterium sp.]
MKTIIKILLVVLLSNKMQSQSKVFSIEEAQKNGISIEKLDLEYKSAVHVDSTKAVFKTEAQQQKLQESYTKLLQDFGSFLNKNNFKWETKTKCFQRIYFAPNGKIDYFIYNFKLKSVLPENLISEEKQKEFQRLLELFAKEYTFSSTATEKFAQCSPTSYQ